jgi:hypothetical protein
MKHLILAVMMIAMLALVANAQVPEPPANGTYSGGWGMNPNDWETTTGSYNSGIALYKLDPAHPAGNGWLVGWDPLVYIDYAPITFELWIEMYMIQTYHYTSYQWHRIGNHAENICALIQGTVKSNEGCWVLCTCDPLVNDPNYLTFQGNMGAGDDRNARDIPVTWEGRWGLGLDYGVDPQMPWTQLTWADGELILDELTACDRWFEFRMCFDLLYHEADGYYSLEITGCPAPTL